MINENAEEGCERENEGCEGCVHEQPHPPYRRKNFRGNRNSPAGSLVRGNSAGD